MYPMAMLTKRKGPSESELLDRLARALAEEVATETGRSELDVLEQIVETGESFHKSTSSRRSPSSKRLPLSRRSALA
jgi:hypothetical protein